MVMRKISNRAVPREQIDSSPDLAGSPSESQFFCLFVFVCLPGSRLLRFLRLREISEIRVPTLRSFAFLALKFFPQRLRTSVVQEVSRLSYVSRFSVSLFSPVQNPCHPRKPWLKAFGCGFAAPAFSLCLCVSVVLI